MNPVQVTWSCGLTRMQAATLTDPCLMQKLAWWVLGSLDRLQQAQMYVGCHMSSCTPHPADASNTLLATRACTQNALQNYWNKNRQDIKRCTAHLLSGKKDVDWVVREACKEPGRNHCFQSNPFPSFALPCSVHDCASALICAGHGLGRRAVWLVRQQR